MGKLLGFFSPIGLKIIAGGVIVVLCAIAVHKYNNHFIQIGYDKRQAEVLKQNEIDAKAHAKEVADALEKGRKGMVDQANIANQLLKDEQNAKNNLQNRLDAYASDNRKLRTITGQAVREPSGSVSDVSTAASERNGACTVRLPDEIGAGFKELRSTIIRITNDADITAKRLAACQAVILSDRQICGVQP